MLDIESGKSNARFELRSSAAPNSYRTVANGGRRCHFLSNTGYADRLFLAHFAMMTFGLVALLGAWHDPVQGFCFATSASTCMLVILLGIISSVHALPSAQLLHRRTTSPTRAYAKSFADAFSFAGFSLSWYCRAHLACVPPAATYSFVQQRGEVHAPISRTLPLFVFPLSGVRLSKSEVQ